jgi:hypothetical protein
MNVFIDIETVPAADRQPFIEEARTNFKAPSTLTKAQAGADLKLSAEEIKFTSAGDLTARWEKEMAELKAPEVAEQAWRKTALDGTKGRVLSIAWRMQNGAHGLHINDPDSERETLQSFVDQLSAALSTHGTGRPPFFIGHNVTFDLKFLFRRCVILGVRPPFALPFHGRHDKDYFCTMEAWCGYGERISLANLCAALNIESSNDMDGSMVCDYWLAGRYAEIAAYNQDDIELTAQVYSALNFAVAA